LFISSDHDVKQGNAKCYQQERRHEPLNREAHAAFAVLPRANASACFQSNRRHVRHCRKLLDGRGL